MVGKKNIVFGFFYFVTTLGLGMFLANQFTLPPEELGAWLQSPQHMLLKTAHVHGNLESTLNIIIGYLLCRLALEAWIAKTVSILMIVGGVFHSGMLYLGGAGVDFAVNLTPVGGISIVVSMVLMGVGVARLKSID